MTVTAASKTVLNLADLSDEAFDQIVNQDVRGSLDAATSAMLRTPEIAARWYDTLLSLKRSVEAQLAANHAEQAAKQAEFLALGPPGKVLWFQAKAQAEKWRAGAIRFKNGLEDKLSEARRLRSEVSSQSYASLVAKERDEAFRELGKLRRAILDHKRIVETAGDDDAEDADERLWAVLESA